MKLPTTDVQILIDKECQELLDFIDLTYIQSEEDNTQNKVVLVLDTDEYEQLVADLDFNNCNVLQISSYLLNPELGEYTTKVTIEKPNGENISFH